VPSEYRNPTPTVDCIIRNFANGQIIMIERKNAPLGLALPGGFVNEGESVEQAVRREVKEELGIAVENLRQFHVYSAPDRDPRQHVMTVAFMADYRGGQNNTLRAGDDAGAWKGFKESDIPWQRLAFDHAKILHEYFMYMQTGKRPDER
jgi:8-oxo-dGTP diphosphatase